MFGKKGKGKQAKEKPEKTKKTTGKRRISPKLLFGILFLLTVGILAGLYFTGRFPGKGGNGSLAPLSKVKIAEPLVRFSSQRLPEIYERLAGLNEEILLIEKEIARIQEIEKAFPGQKKVTSSEVKIWDKTRKGLEKSLLNLEKNIELFYVAYRVNIEKGEKLMESKEKELTRSVDGVLAPSRKQTERLRPKADNRSRIDKVKDKIMGYIPFIGKK